METEYHRAQIQTVTLSDEDYPYMLRQIKDPPSLLYYRGDIRIASKKCISVVGSRHGTGYGKWVANALGKKLAEYNVPLVSGMAMGIDTYGHMGALEGGGETIAVFGSGIDVCYPKSNKPLMDKILESGLILSEYPPGFKPTTYSFPARNRIISGISYGTVIVEAGLSSGSLITAEFAGEQGRSVYAVPGNINNIFSIGANKLIKDGVTPLIILEDVIEDLGLERKAVIATRGSLGKDEEVVFDAIEKGGESTVDNICKTTGKHPGEVNALITVLEMKGIVYSCMGKIFIAK